MSNKTMACDNCGKHFDPADLDGKPPQLAGVPTTNEMLSKYEGEDFTVSECVSCYGPAWCAL